MKYNELKLESRKKSIRAGRGISAGRGKTAGRGTKGQRARTGSGKRPGFEGGQNPLLQRIPKLPGFRSHKPKAENVYTDQLDALKLASVDNHTLAEAGLVSSPYVRVKLLARGEVTGTHTVSLQGASASAQAQLQKAGGTFTRVVIPQRQKTSKKTEDQKK